MRLIPLYAILLALVCAWTSGPLQAADSRPPSLNAMKALAAGEDADAAAPSAMPAQSGMPMNAAPQGSTSLEYVLGVGDEIRLIVYGEDDLSGQYLVSSTGMVALPLIGNIHAADRTILEFEKAVRAKLAGGYLKDPRVSVEVANYRPFFILGEVAKPGSYPYVNGMTVLNAVALAGGYTYRAAHDDFKLTHANDPDKTEYEVHEDAAVKPGDIIRVRERFF